MWDHLHNLHVFDHSFLSYFTGGGDTICICPFSKMFKEYWGDMILYENETYASSHHDCCDKVYNDPTHLYEHLADSKKAHVMVVCYLRRVYGCRGKMGDVFAYKNWNMVSNCNAFNTFNIPR